MFHRVDESGFKIANGDPNAIVRGLIPALAAHEVVVQAGDILTVVLPRLLRTQYMIYKGHAYADYSAVGCAQR